MGFEHATTEVYILTFLLLAPLAYFIRLAKNNKDLYVRRISGIDAVDEVLGRSVEQGRPIVFTTGMTSLSPVLYACLGVLFYVAKRNATYKNNLYVPQNDPEVLAITEDTLKAAYQSSGRLSYFSSEQVPYFSQEQFAYAAGYIGLVQRESVGGAFLFGHFAAESLILAEAGQQVGAVQVGASISPEQVPFFITTCDYTLIGEELFAASAYLSRDAIQLGSLYAQDSAKFLILIIIITGVCWETLQNFYAL